MGELVALETQTFSTEHKSNPTEDDAVDFAAATTATLGVPSPILSKVRSFDDPSHPVADCLAMRKGDLEEEVELLRVLKLSEAEVPNSVARSPAAGHDGSDESGGLLETKCTGNNDCVNIIRTLEDQGAVEYNNHKVETSEPNVSITLNTRNSEVSSEALAVGVMASFSSEDVGDHPVQLKQEESKEALLGNAAVGEKTADSSIGIEDASPVAKQNDSANEILKDPSRESEEAGNSPTPPPYTVEEAKILNGGSTTILSSNSEPYAGPDSSSGRLEHLDETNAFTPSIGDSEPIYEGEECILDSCPKNFEDREPVYEGEIILARKADKSAEDDLGVGSKTELTLQQGQQLWEYASLSSCR